MICIVIFNHSDGCTYGWEEPVPVECDSLEDLYVDFCNVKPDKWGNKTFLGRDIHPEYEGDPQFLTLENWVELYKE